jgi:hypothetical protein
LDDSDSGSGIFGGYKFFKHMAVEARYNDFGTFTLEGFGVLVTVAGNYSDSLVWVQLISS